MGAIVADLDRAASLAMVRLGPTTFNDLVVAVGVNERCFPRALRHAMLRVGETEQVGCRFARATVAAI
jgi:hypothetical protein